MTSLSQRYMGHIPKFVFDVTLIVSLSVFFSFHIFSVFSKYTLSSI